MKLISCFLIVASLYPSLITAITLGPRSASPRTVALPIERRSGSSPVKHDRLRSIKRRNTVSATLDNEQTLYYANITLGTPPQSLQLHIDTGSSDLWVNTDTSRLCRSETDACEGGTYDAGASSTYNLISNDFNISYVDGSNAVGDYVSDTLDFGGQTLREFQFGVGESSSSREGVLGIGYALNEVQVNRAGLQPYPNLPVAMVNAGLINSNAYSLWLNDLDASTGTILFGGVDTAKYAGELATLPIIQTYGNYLELVIALTGLSMAGQDFNSASSLPTAALLDSGSTLTYLPDDLVTDIYNKIQAVYVANIGAAYAPCDLQNSDSTLDFTFSGQKISVPYNELVIDAGTDQNGQPLTFQNGQTACLFGIAPAGQTTAVLGDTFLRSAYVVYDLDNNEISIAQTTFNATSDDVREIGKGSGAVPNATPVSNPVTDVAAATGGQRLDGGSTATVTGFGGPTATNSASPNQVPFVFVAIVAALITAFSL